MFVPKQRQEPLSEEALVKLSRPKRKAIKKSVDNKQELLKLQQEIEALEFISLHKEILNKRISLEKGSLTPRRYEAVNYLVQVDGLDKRQVIFAVNNLWDSVTPDPTIVSHDINPELQRISRQVYGLQISSKQNQKSIVTKGLEEALTGIFNLIREINK